MISPNDVELWSALSRQWQTLTVDHPVIDLRAYVDRHRRRLRWLFLVDIAVTLVAVGAAVWFFLHNRWPFGVLFAADTVAVLVIVWTFSIVTGRGLARASASSTSDYLDLARRFARRRLQTVHLALALLAGQLVVVGVLFRAVESPVARSFPLIPAGATIGWLAWAFVTRRRTLRELAALDAIEQETIM